MVVKISMFHLMQHRDLPDDFEDNYESVWWDPPYNELAESKQISQYYNWTLDELLYAANQGLDGICTNEHHQNAYGFQPSPNVMGGVLAKQTNQGPGSDSAVVQMGATLPSNPIPLRVAEEYAMLDLISEGRLVAGLPLGTPMDVNLCYGQKPLQQRERYREYHDFLKECWARDEIFTFNGKYVQLPKVNPWPQPMQTPHPPVWVPGSGSRTTQEFAAENDYCYCYLSFQGHKIARNLVDQYWEVLDEKGKPANPYRLGFAQLVTVGESDAQAEELYADHIEYFYHKHLHVKESYQRIPGYLFYEDMKHVFRRAERAGDYSEEADDPQEMEYRDFVDGGQVISGGPKTVADQLRDVIKGLRCGNLMVLLPIGSMGHELTKKNISLFANEVMPRIRDIWTDEWENHWWPERLRETETMEAE